MPFNTIHFNMCAHPLNISLAARHQPKEHMVVPFLSFILHFFTPANCCMLVTCFTSKYPRHDKSSAYLVQGIQLLLISLHLFTLLIAAHTCRVTWLKNNAFSLCLYTLKLYMVKHSTHSNSQQDCGLLLARSTRWPSTWCRHSTVLEGLFSACHTYNLAQCVECCVDRGVWYNWPFRLNCQPTSALIWR